MTDYSKYKESAFTHEEMQPMIIETDMTDIVERLRGKVPMAWEDEGFMSADEDAILATFKEAADEIERLREALWPFVEPCIEHCYETCESEEERIEDCICFKARAALG